MPSSLEPFRVLINVLFNRQELIYHELEYSRDAISANFRAVNT
jgi:hypothetical protein